MKQDNNTSLTGQRLEVPHPDTTVVTPSNPWPDPIDKAAYFGLAGEIVRAIEPHTEADPVALLIQFLVAFGNAIGRGAYFVADGAKHRMNLFAVLVGETSKARKGTSWAQVRRIFESCADEWAKERIMNGLSSGEGVIWQVRDEIRKAQQDKKTKKVEEVVVDLGVVDKRLLVCESEFSSVLRVCQREGNTLSAIIRSAWETGDLRFMTKNSPAKATGAHISIIGHIVAEELHLYLNRSEIAGGFANRFLWVCVRRSKCLPDGGELDSVDFSPILKRLADTIEFARKTGELRRDKAARAIWHGVYPELSEGRPGLAGALIARSEAQVMRLAAIYALLDASYVIQTEHLYAALALWEYAQESVHHVFGSSLGDPVADELLAALRASPTGMTRTEIRDFFGRNRSGDRIGRALESLRAAKLVTREEENTGGRPAERWRAVTQ